MHDFTETLGQLKQERANYVEQVKRLDLAIDALESVQIPVGGALVRIGKPAEKAAFSAPLKRKSNLSPQGRKNIIAAQKKRWANTKRKK